MAEGKGDRTDYSAYGSLSWFSRSRTAGAKVLVAGCGALGNEALKNFALFGVGRIVLIDRDRVEKSNLTRSVLFTPADAASGRLKVEAAADGVRRLNPDVRVLPIAGDVCHDLGLGLLREMDAVVGCLDNRYARYCLNRLCMRAGVPWIDGGIIGLEGTARVFAPGRSCYACSLGEEGLRDLAAGASCSGLAGREAAAGRVPTTPVIASIIGAVQAQEAMKLICRDALEEGSLSSLSGRMFYYEGQHMTVRTAEAAAYDDDCPEHEAWEPVACLGLSSESTVGETLDAIAEMTAGDNPALHLTNFAFADFAEDKLTGERLSVMLPSHRADGFLKAARPENFARSTLFKHEIKLIDRNFKHKSLTLKQIGFALKDVARVSGGGSVHYVLLEDPLAFE